MANRMSTIRDLASRAGSDILSAAREMNMPRALAGSAIGGITGSLIGSRDNASPWATGITGGLMGAGLGLGGAAGMVAAKRLASPTRMNQLRGGIMGSGALMGGAIGGTIGGGFSLLDSNKAYNSSYARVPLDRRLAYDRQRAKIRAEEQTRAIRDLREL